MQARESRSARKEGRPERPLPTSGDHGEEAATAAADEAAEKALSGDSERFLAANRQRSGE